MPRCRDCQLYDLDYVKSKSGAILPRRAARCLWRSTETWPESVDLSANRRPYAGWMLPNEEHRCKRFAKRYDAKPNTKAMETNT